MSDETESEGGIGNLVISVVTDGRRYDMALGDFSARDEMDFKEIAGEDLLTPFTTGKANSVTIAGLVWLFRRRFEKNLRFDKVAVSFKLGDLDTIRVAKEGEEDAPALPEVVTDPEG
jgi:hypothetical protein